MTCIKETLLGEAEMAPTRTRRNVIQREYTHDSSNESAVLSIPLDGLDQFRERSIDIRHNQKEKQGEAASEHAHQGL